MGITKSRVNFEDSGAIHYIGIDSNNVFVRDADHVEFDGELFHLLKEAWILFGEDGIIALMSIGTNQTPLPEYQTENYIKALLYYDNRRKEIEEGTFPD